MNPYMLILICFIIYPIRYTHIYYKKLKSIKTQAHKHRLYRAPFTVERNENKCKYV